jgi:Flp pilus assembly protein TadD
MPLHAQEGGRFSLQLTPGVNLPLGSSTTAMFSVGGGAELTAIYRLSFAPVLAARASIDYSLVPTIIQTTLHLASAGVGLGVTIDPFSWLNVQASATGGYGLGIYKGQFGGSPYISGEAAASFIIARFLGLGIGVSYRHYFSQPTPFYQCLRVNLGTSFRLGVGARKPLLKIAEVRFDPVFPVFYAHYDDHPLGSVLIRNNESETIKEVRVSLLVNKYMDKPKQCAVISEMRKGEEKEVPLYALFTDQVLKVTEGTKVVTEVQVDYRVADNEFSVQRSETLRLYDRNAMNWDDDRKAAAFVTAKDPEILKFSKGMAGLVRDQGNKAVNLNFRIAVGLFEALGCYGVHYVVDPKTPYTEFSENAGAVDYLQFPVHTMNYRAGDCDDLSILYCTLLESTGIETAFVTVPGHIFMAFSLGMSPEEAGRLFLNPQDLICVGDAAWLPVEVTSVQAGFLQAWDNGAKQWRENEASKKARFYPIHEAWTLYEPVGLPESDITLAQVVSSEALGRYTKALTRFVEREISPKVAELEEKIRAHAEDPKPLNKMGVLYAQYGLLDKAREQFEKAAARQYAPALANLGNVSFMEKKFEEALDYFRQAQKMAPEDTATLLGIAKASYELEKHEDVRTAYDKIRQKDPKLAERISYLVAGSTEAGRASAMALAEETLWSSEE